MSFFLFCFVIVVDVDASRIFIGFSFLGRMIELQNGVMVCFCKEGGFECSFVVEVIGQLTKVMVVA